MEKNMKNYITIMIINLIIIGCAVYEPIPGLCYTDKTGTYLCDRNEPMSTPEAAEVYQGMKTNYPNYDPELDSSATNFCPTK